MAPTLRNDSGQGKAEQEKFKAVLQSMHGIKHKPCMLPDSVSKLCAFIDMPELAAGTPVSQTPRHLRRSHRSFPATEKQLPQSRRRLQSQTHLSCQRTSAST